MKPKYPKYAKEVHELLSSLENDQDNRETEPQTTIPDTNTAQDIYVFILRENPDLAELMVIDSVAEVEDLDTTPLSPQPISNVGLLPFGVFVILICLFC